MFWHSILPSHFGCKDSANRMQRARSMLRCSLFSQIRLQKYQGGVPKLWTPPKELTLFKNFSCHLPHFLTKIQQHQPSYLNHQPSLL